jgi:outer membrane protein OmpA-like peptidoglycan-associated protein
LIFGSLLSLTVAAGCKGSVQTPAPAEPAPAVAETIAPAEEEPETEPLVAEPPKNIEIQRNVIRLKPGIKILFETGSDKLEQASFEILDEVASVMAQNERIRVRVEGHTDNVGKEDANKDLSTRRAASVRTYLAGKGVAEERLESTGCGQGTPIVANDNDENRAQNRRVEFVILRRKRVIEPCQIYKPRERRDRGAEAAPAGGATPAATPAPATN